MGVRFSHCKNRTSTCIWLKQNKSNCQGPRRTKNPCYRFTFVFLSLFKSLSLTPRPSSPSESCLDVQNEGASCCRRMVGRYNHQNCSSAVCMRLLSPDQWSSVETCRGSSSVQAYPLLEGGCVRWLTRLTAHDTHRIWLWPNGRERATKLHVTDDIIS